MTNDIRDLQLYPAGHELHGLIVFDRIEKLVYDSRTDMFYSPEESIAEMQAAVERFTVL